MFYLKKISKIKIKKYFYIYLDKKRINLDIAISLIPEANPEEIEEIKQLNKKTQ
jgi:predicted CopG family antitoxin